MSKRCATSRSMMSLPLGAQILWHRLVQDGGVDDWGVFVGDAEVVHHDCLALTTDCTVDECREWLALFVERGLLFSFSFEDEPYFATVKHEDFAWKTKRAVPVLPMSQEVADTRKFDRLNPAKNRREKMLEKLDAWCSKCGIEVNAPGTVRNGSGTVRNGSGTVTVPPVNGSPGVSVRGSVSEGVRVRGEESSTPPATDQPTPRPPTGQALKDWPKEAASVLRQCGTPNVQKVSQLLSPDQWDSGGGDIQVVLTAIGLESIDAAKSGNQPARALFRWSTEGTSKDPDRRDVPTPEFVSAAKRLLKPKRARILCDVCKLPQKGSNPEDPCDGCSGTMREVS